MKNKLKKDCPQCGNDKYTHRNSCDELFCDSCGYSEAE